MGGKKTFTYCKVKTKQAFCSLAGLLAEMNGQHVPALIISQP